MQVRGKLTITKQYAYSANLTPKDIADFGFEASGNDYYRKITTVGTKINLQ